MSKINGIGTEIKMHFVVTVNMCCIFFPTLFSRKHPILIPLFDTRAEMFISLN